ncbi:glucose 1-dehydrogenase [Pseudochrobactrum algeriensis]|uniref:glucose 1-dehydrogenase n=1 Tax=Brucellaceae TaxID=118882 RepID=UPI001BCE7F66|nr:MULTISPECIES: glucose 1-dehydrogenase [Brucellaceae]MBX8812349.1 glucose 1-dehydrogenase [Ochrobactrum sp. MR34]MBX8824197.1 glucose 1-dehydrogenase [Ochrobactrum sp. SFR4]QVQ37153.1 glucose 1-dehydrogenase [Pseudochrobactrum algeriensis]QVQ40370.1 glucose 1-dehydrogenase [Pseudochrobactrum algeriensis]QVQ44293.1 glucose 1-dehydrogenase [Pseudochrobactrum algeriensis]
MTGSLENKTAIITGAGSGFGEAMARKFAREGANVVVVDRDAAGAKRVAGELGGKGLAVEADIASENGVAEAVRQAQMQFGRIDILINNAGIGHKPQPAENVQPDEFDRIVGVNIRGIYLMSRALIPHFKDNGGGVILNIASTGAARPRPNLTWYNATKGWVVSATKALAIELAPENIRVNALNPVAGETPLLTTFMGEDTEEIRQKFRASIPLGRLLKPEDLAESAAFLCSPAASMITGVALDVDGGRSI